MQLQYGSYSFAIDQTLLQFSIVLNWNKGGQPYSQTKKLHVKGYHLVTPGQTPAQNQNQLSSLDNALADALGVPYQTLQFLGNDSTRMDAPAERLSFAPDCGLSQTARWAARQKLINMVQGVAIVRKELGLA